jgi:hypothetical protein
MPHAPSTMPIAIKAGLSEWHIHDMHAPLRSISFERKIQQGEQI